MTPEEEVTIFSDPDLANAEIDRLVNFNNEMILTPTVSAQAAENAALFATYIDNNRAEYIAMRLAKAQAEVGE